MSERSTTLSGFIRSVSALGLLLVAGCDAQEIDVPAGEPAGANSADIGLANLTNATNPADAATLQARVSAAMASVLVDPDSARYANVRSGSAGSVCGDVDVRGRGGAYVGPRPFVVTPAGAAFIGTSAAIRLEDPSDPFPEVYMQYCATREELRQMGERLERIGRLPPGTIPEPVDPALELPPAAGPPAETPKAGESARQAGEGRRGEDGSFSDAVLRRPREDPPPK